MLRYPVLFLLAVYKKIISPLLPPACRFEPTCSVYMMLAVKHRGALIGVWLGMKRLSRCRPFGGQGWDPVPHVDETLQVPHITPGSPYRPLAPDAPPGPPTEPPSEPPPTASATSGGRTAAAE